MSLIGQKGSTKFHELLAAQVRNEFTASQQYVALAVWFDSQDLPRLAAHFYRQALEERNHAMMFIQYQLDNGLPVSVPGVDDVRNDFSSVHELIELAVHQERRVTEEITALAGAARADGDYVGEQFVQWFLKEQVEEVAAMSTLLIVVERAGDNLFHVEDFLARESVGDAAIADPMAPRAAGGRLPCDPERRPRAATQSGDQSGDLSRDLSGEARPAGVLAAPRAEPLPSRP